MLLNIVRIDVEPIVDEIAAVLKKNDVPYTFQFLVDLVEGLTKIYARESGESIYTFFSRNRLSKCKVLQGMSWAYVMLQDLIDQHLDVRHDRVVGICKHAYNPEITIEYRPYSSDESFAKWLRRRADDYETPPEVARLIEEYEYSTGQRTVLVRS